MFGELIGLWAGSVWRQMGSPQQVHLVELGPGRGSMMQDAMRAAHVMPEFRAAASVHLVEISPLLERRQKRVPRRHRHTAHLAPVAQRRAGRPDDHPGQRVLRFAAGASGGDVRRRLARARGQDRREPEAPLRHRPRSDSAVRPAAAARHAGRDRRGVRMARRPDRARARPSGEAFGRRRPGDRLRPCQERPRRDPAGGRQASICRSAGVARAGRPDRPCGFPGAGRGRREHGGARATDRSIRASSCAGWASNRAPRRSRTRRRPAR